MTLIRRNVELERRDRPREGERACQCQAPQGPRTRGVTPGYCAVDDGREPIGWCKRHGLSVAIVDEVHHHEPGAIDRLLAGVGAVPSPSVDWRALHGFEGDDG